MADVYESGADHYDIAYQAFDGAIDNYSDDDDALTAVSDVAAWLVNERELDEGDVRQALEDACADNNMAAPEDWGSA